MAKKVAVNRPSPFDGGEADVKAAVAESKTASTALAKKAPEEQFKAEALTLVEKANALVVSNDEQYKAAIEFGKGAGSLIDKIVDWFKPLKKAASDAHKALCTRENEELELPKKAQSIAREKATAYKVEQDRLARERAAEEQRRREAEAAEQRRREIEAAKAAGNKQLAKAVAAAPVVVEEVKVEQSTPKVSGVRSRKQPCFRVLDAAKVPREFLVVDERLIREAVRERVSKEASNVQPDLATIPGVACWYEDKLDF